MGATTALATAALWSLPRSRSPSFFPPVSTFLSHLMARPMTKHAYLQEEDRQSSREDLRIKLEKGYTNELQEERK
jgi:hypothetical protein